MREEIPKKILEQAYKNYGDSHTTWPTKTGNWLDEIPMVKPMAYGKSEFFKLCYKNADFLEKWINQNKDE